MVEFTKSSKLESLYFFHDTFNPPVEKLLKVFRVLFPKKLLVSKVTFFISCVKSTKFDPWKKHEFKNMGDSFLWKTGTSTPLSIFFNPN
jgi:hypothetical protein